MDETVFREILREAVMLDYDAIDNVPEHKFSFKHKRAMKRIFARFERNTNKIKHREIVKISYDFENKPRLSLKQRVIITTILILLMTFLVGWMWIVEGLYKIDDNSLKGYTVNHTMLSQVKNQISTDNSVPTHKITEEQMEWLKSKYDLEFLSACSITNEEYGKFILDLVKLNVFSIEDVENMYGVMPFNANHKGYLYALDTKDGKTGYVNPFSGEENYLDNKNLQKGLAVEYLKSEYNRLSEDEYIKMAEDLADKRCECLSVIEYIFDKGSPKNDNAFDTSNPAVTIQNINY